MPRAGKKVPRKVMNAKQKRAVRKSGASRGHLSSELIRQAMKRKGSLSSAAQFLTNGVASGGNGKTAAGRLVSEIALKASAQRFVDLYDFAPIAYVSFDRSGHIKEINIAAAKLLGLSRKQLIDSLFAVHVLKEDSSLFLNHLLRCRTAQSRVETELRLKKRTGEMILAHLASSPTTSSLYDGLFLYQTAIVDLTEQKRAEEAIRQSELRYRTLFDLVPVAVYTCDANGLILEFNQRAVELWGRKPKTNDPKEKFCGSFKIFFPDGRPMAHKDCPMARALRGEKFKASDLEIVVEREDGARRNVAVNPTALRNGRGKIIGAINCLYDITERKEAEEELRESEERHRALVSQTAAGMARTNLKGQLEFVNGEFCEMLGYKQSELIGKTISEITHPDDVAESRRLFQRLVREGAPYQLEKRYLRKDGSVLWVNVSASPMRNVNAKTQSAIAVIVDISERKKIQEALEDSTALLENRVAERTAELIAANEVLHTEIAMRKRLEGEIIEISDREQRRLGQDLHDSLCQNLTAIAFMARAVARRLTDHRVIDVVDIEKIAELINDGVTEARTIARGLHPVEMDSAGLSSALRSLLQRQSKLPYCLDMDEEISISDPTVALHLFRIAREAVVNANKHARARELVLRMRRLPKEFELSIIDDGVGPPRRFMEGPGMGFHIMEYRARSIGARLEITAVKPHGTRVTCHLPHK